MMQTLPNTVTPFNFADLIIIAVLVWSTLQGARRGLIHTLIHLVGRVVIVLGAGWLARLFSPILAAQVIAPLIQDAFTTRLSQDPALADICSQLPVNEAVMMVAQGIAFLILSLLLILGLSVVLSIVSRGLHFITRFPPLGWLNQLAGGVLGLAGGLLVIWLALWLCHAVRPDLFGPLGVLSPNYIAHTVLLRGLLTYFPIL